MKQYEYPVALWLTETYIEYAAEILADPQRTAALTTSGPEQKMGEFGWLRVGDGILRCQLVDPADIVNGQVDALRQQIQTARAEAQRKVEQLEDAIQKLLALPNLAKEV